MLFHKQIENIYRSQLFVRCDDRGLVKYYAHTDFSGLSAVPYVFPSSGSHMLQGYFYSYDDANPARLVVFEHGFGGGHRSYMKEIERLCRAGYRVFAYDHTGCMESGGVGAGGFGQSLADLDDCLHTLKADPAVCCDDISVIGHSWGGLSTLNIVAFHPDVKRIVTFAAPLSVDRMIAQNFSGLLKGYRRYIKAMETGENPRYVDCDGITALQNAPAGFRALLIYSDNDRLVHKSVHYDPLQAALGGKEGIELVLEPGKGHNPNYTREAVDCLAILGKGMKKAVKLKTPEEKETFKNSFDWEKMTAQDEVVWQKVLDFLNQ